MSSMPPTEPPYGQPQPPPQQQPYGQPVPPPQQYPQVAYGQAPWQPQGPTCPRCQSPNIMRVRYTWWGGIIGPNMMALTKCRDCRLQFNGKTGKDVSTAILVYTLVVVGVGIVIGVAAVLLRG